MSESGSWTDPIHGTILTLVALAGAVATTIGRTTGTGLFGFMQQNPMVWVGLIQAYLLMTIIAVLLVLGSSEANARKWNVVGALAHGAPLIAALSSLDVFASMGRSGLFAWLLRSTLSGSVLKRLLHFIQTRGRRQNGEHLPYSDALSCRIVSTEGKRSIMIVDVDLPVVMQLEPTLPY